MSANGSAMPQEASETTEKGKGKAVEQPRSHDMSMDDDDSSEESAHEEEVYTAAALTSDSDC